MPKEWTPKGYDGSKAVPPEQLLAQFQRQRNPDIVPLREVDDPIVQRMADFCKMAPGDELAPSMIAFGGLGTGLAFALDHPEETRAILDMIDAKCIELGVPGFLTEMRGAADKLFRGH